MERVFRNEKYNWCDNLIIGLFCFLIFLSTISLSTALVNDWFQKSMIYNLETYIIYVLIFFTLIDNVLCKKRISIFVLIPIITACISMFAKQQDNFIIILILAIVLSKYDIDEILSKIFPLFIIAIITIIFLSMCGFSENIIMFRSDGKIRYSLGFWHPNSAATIFFMLILIKLYLNKFTISLSEFILIMLMSCLVFYLTDSRASVIMMMLAILCAGIYSVYRNKLDKLKFIFNYKFIKTILILMPIIMCFISLLLTFLYAKDVAIAKKINNFLSGRLYYSNMAVKEFELSLFGSDLISDKTIILDNSYIANIYRIGIVNSVIVLVILSISIKKIMDLKNYSLILVCMFILCFSLIEFILLYYRMNIFFIVIMYAFNTNHKIKGNANLWNKYQ